MLVYRKGATFAVMFLILFTLTMPISALCDEIGRNDLQPSSAACREVRSSGYISHCGERSPLLNSFFLGAFVGPTQVKQRMEIAQFVSQLRANYLKRVYSSLASHYESIVWLIGRDYLKEIDSVERKLITGKLKCEESADLERDRANFEKGLKERERHRPVEMNGVASPEEEALKTDLLKKYAFAALELDRLLSDRSSDAPLERGVRDQIERLLDSYPLLSLNRKFLQEFRENLERSYSIAFNPATRKALEFNAEKLIYPKVFDTDETIEFSKGERIRARDLTPVECQETGSASGDQLAGEHGCRAKFDSALIANIINKPLSASTKANIGKMMYASWRSQVANLNKFCDISPCNLISFNAAETANQINAIANRFARQSALAFVCDCGIREPTVLLSEDTKDILSTALVAGSVVCPFTFGFGCMVAGSTGVILSGTAILEAATDVGRARPTLRLATEFPALANAENMQALEKFNQDAADRSVVAGVTTVLVIGGGNAVGQIVMSGGKKVLVHFRPGNRVTAPAGK